MLAAGFAALALVGAAAPVEAAGAATVAFRLDDPRLDEASGIAVGITSPGVVYVQNDSGDQARFFALDLHTGRTLAVYTVPGAQNVDWEDLAVARDAAGQPSVWLGDIGDNDANRTQVQLYRVPEPDVGDGLSPTRTSAAPEIWRLRYPDGPHDAESLAVSPTGAAVIVTKALDGASEVFAVPATSDGGTVQSLTRIGSIRFGPTGTANPFGLVGELTATGAAWSPDGRTLAVRTYSDAYFWTLPTPDLAGVGAALATTPRRLALPEQPQGEGIAFDGAAVLVDSEHAASTVYRVPIPTGPPPPGGASGPSSHPAAPSAAPTSTGAGPAGPAGAPAKADATTGTSGRGDPTLSALRAALAIGAVAVIGLGAQRLRTRRRGRGS